MYELTTYDMYKKPLKGMPDQWLETRKMTFLSLLIQLQNTKNLQWLTSLSISLRTSSLFMRRSLISLKVEALDLSLGTTLSSTSPLSMCRWYRAYTNHQAIKYLSTFFDLRNSSLPAWIEKMLYNALLMTRILLFGKIGIQILPLIKYWHGPTV